MTEEKPQGYPVRMGGVFDCCIATAKAHTGTPAEGEILECNHCNDTLIFTRGAWQWKKAEFVGETNAE